MSEKETQPQANLFTRIRDKIRSTFGRDNRLVGANAVSVHTEEDMPTSVEAVAMPEEERRDQTVQNLAEFLVTIVPFPWDYTNVYVEAPPKLFNDQMIAEIAERLSSLGLSELSTRDWYYFGSRLRLHFNRESDNHGVDDATAYVNGRWGGHKSRIFEKQRDEYITQAVAAIKIALSETTWTDVGVFNEDDPQIVDATTHLVDYKSGLARRVGIVSTNEDEGTSQYVLQERRITDEDRAMLIEQLMISQAKSMVYYDITGEFPGENPDWQVVTAAISQGQYVDYLGNQERLDWKDRRQVFELSTRYLKFTMELLD